MKINLFIENGIRFFGVIILLLSNTAFSQENFAVFGQIKDSAGIAVYAGNVIVRDSEDSTVIAGTYFFEGDFRIGNLKQNSFILEVRALGYESYIRTFEKKDLGDYDVGEIRINAEDLESVTVFGFKDRITLAADKLSVDVESSMLSSSNSILDLLANTPNVIVIDGEVTVFGKGRPIFYLNNQKVSLETLKSIPVSEIKSVEIITNPSARYEADATAVIRIVTKDFNLEGFQVDLKQNIRKGLGILSYSEVGVNFRKGKLALNVNYNIEFGTSSKVDDYTRIADYGDEIFNSIATTNTRIKHNNQSSYLVGVNYNLTKKSILSFQWNGRYTNTDYELNTKNDVMLGSDFNYQLFSESIISPTKLLSNRFSLNYIIDLDTLGSNISFGGQFTNQKDSYNNLLKEVIIQEIETPIWQKKLDYLGDIDIYTGNIEYELKMRKKNALRLGTKISSVRNHNESDFEVRVSENNSWISSPDFTSLLNYDEDYLAGFVEYEQEIKSIFFNIGLRGEFTKSLIKNANTVLYDTTYLNVFPAFSIKRGNLSLNYGMKIKRIPFDYLNTVSVYIDSFSVSKGNPYLLPTFYNSVDLNYADLIVLGYSRITNEIQQLFIQDEDANRTIITFDNISKMDRFTASLIVPIPSKKFVSYLVSGCNYTVSLDERFMSGNVKPKPQFYAYGYGSFDIKKWFKLQVIGQYVSGSSNGISTLKSFGNVDLAISKLFFEEKFSIEIYGGDIFRTTIYNGTQFSETTNATFNVVSDTRFIRLTLKYNFGRLKSGTYKENEIGKEENERTKSSVQ